jgi:C-terminal processing protease CtpA/Prc
VEKLAEQLERKYVFPEVGAHIAGVIRGKGEPAGVDAAATADLLTRWLRDASGDRHLLVEHQVRQAEDAREPDEREFRAGLARQQGYGVARVERLAGNVGLVELTEFLEPYLAGEVLSAAIRIVADCEALIIDLRRNGGGCPETVAMMISYLFDADKDPVHLNDNYDRPSDKTHQYWTLPCVPGTRYGSSKPVYVLTSERTFSAAEEFAYDLQALGRALIVGETTAGGAHPGESVRLDDELVAFIPTGRAINPVTGTNWEGTGVTPDIIADAAQAPDTAHRHALRALLGAGAMDRELAAEATAVLDAASAWHMSRLAAD